MNFEQEVVSDHVELRTDETNELYFRVTVEGAERSPDAIRLVCEAGEVTYAFRGQPTNEVDVLRFVVPPLNNMVKPGVLYEAAIEVLVENKYFIPVRFKTEFKRPVRVVAEVVKQSNVPSLHEKKDTPASVSRKPTIEVRAQPMKRTLRDMYVERQKNVNPR